MRVILAAFMCLMLCGCSMKPFGFAPWVIVMPGAKLNVVIGNKSEDRRSVTEKAAKPEPVAEKSDSGFKPPKMTDD